MLKRVMRAVVIVAVACTGLFAGAGVASAAAPIAGINSVASAPAVTGPTSLIKGAGTTRKFVPNSLTAAPATGTCSSTNFSFFVKNLTKHTQTLMYNGAQLGNPISPSQGIYICASGAGSGTITLKGDPNAKLHFTIT